MARNRVIYQSQALFIAPTATGAQIATGASLPTTTNTNLSGPKDISDVGTGISLLKKLDRVQSCNFNFTINRQDINEFGKLARLDSIVMESPTVGLDFSYYVTDGLNERLLGFNIEDAQTSNDPNVVDNCQAISGLIADLEGNNYYILTVQEGEDVAGSATSLPPANSNTVVGIGNGFISEYSFEAAVGAIPTATVTVEGFNIKADAGTGNADGGITGASPAIDISTSPATKLSSVKNNYKLTGVYNTGNSSVTALRPGDIVLSLPSDADTDGFSDINGANSAHIQSFSFTLPLTRTVLQRLGNTFGFARVIDVPINMDITINAIVSELTTKNIFDNLCTANKRSMNILLKDCNGTDKIKFTISGAIFQSETYSQNLGDNQTVDLTYTVQIGGANDTENGLFMSGSYTSDYITSGFFKLGTAKTGIISA
jgi:hypothetical protein